MQHSHPNPGTPSPPGVRNAESPPPPGRPPGSVQLSAAPRHDQISTVDLAWALCARLRDPDQVVGCDRELGLLRSLLWPFDRGHNNRFSREKASFPMRILKTHPSWDTERIRDATVIEFGAGGMNPFGALVPFLAHGAKRVLALDLEPLPDTRTLARFAYEQLADITLDPRGYLGRDAPGSHEVIDAISWIGMQSLRKGDKSAIAGERLAYLQTPADSTGLPDASVDLAISVSFFEHVPDVDAVLAELARILRPGGIATHEIDGRDHRYYQSRNTHELEFLRERSDAPILHGCNRIRPMAYPEIFERHGFRVVQARPGMQTEVSDELRASLQPEFRKLPIEFLETVTGRFHLERV